MELPGGDPAYLLLSIVLTTYYLLLTTCYLLLATHCQAELAALFELLGDGGGIDGHGSADPDVDSVIIDDPNPTTLTLRP